MNRIILSRPSSSDGCAGRQIRSSSPAALHALVDNVCGSAPAAGGGADSAATTTTIDAFKQESLGLEPSQRSAAFAAGPKERICVLGNPVEHCPRCRNDGLGTTGWRPHRHIGELKIRYICERHFDDLESPHHCDIPLCPLCNQVSYLYEFNMVLGVSITRRLHKYVLKCCNRHVLPLLDLFCQTKKGGERCNANLKLQWTYGTMVQRCETQKNRDHDLWWVRYKNEWKQRRTIIRYKKDFLCHLAESQRNELLSLGLEGEPPPDPRTTLGHTYTQLMASGLAGSPSRLRAKRRAPSENRRSEVADNVNGRFGMRNSPLSVSKRRFFGSQNLAEPDQSSPFNSSLRTPSSSRCLFDMADSSTSQLRSQRPTAGSCSSVRADLAEPSDPPWMMTTTTLGHPQDDQPELEKPSVDQLLFSESRQADFGTGFLNSSPDDNNNNCGTMLLGELVDGVSASWLALRSDGALPVFVSVVGKNVSAVTSN